MSLYFLYFFKFPYVFFCTITENIACLLVEAFGRWEYRPGKWCNLYHNINKISKNLANCRIYPEPIPTNYEMLTGMFGVKFPAHFGVRLYWKNCDLMSSLGGQSDWPTDFYISKFYSSDVNGYCVNFLSVIRLGLHYFRYVMYAMPIDHFMESAQYKN